MAIPTKVELDQIYEIIKEAYFRFHNESDVSIPLEKWVERVIPYILQFGIDKIDYIQFNKDVDIPEHSEAKLHWDDDTGTLELGLTGGEVKLQIGFEILLKGKNLTGVSETNGKIVYISGATGNNPTFELADADNITSASAIGWFTEDVNKNGNGYVTTEGRVNEIDTSAWKEGDILWLSDTAGEATNIRPEAPLFSVIVGVVLRKSATEGTVYVRIDIVPRLRGLSDVYSPTTPNDGEILYWSDTNQRWQVSPNIKYIESSQTVQIGDTVNVDYSSWNNKGELRVYGDATQWDDFSVPLNPSLLGSRAKPDYDETELGLQFPQDDTSEFVNFTAQMSHSKLLDTDIHLHCHYIQSSVTQPTFTVEYRYYNNGDQVPATWATLNTSDVGGGKGVFTYTSGSILQIARFPAIPAPTDETVSANLDVKFYRNDNDVTGDVLTKYIDFHYQINSLGSNEEFTKY